MGQSPEGSTCTGPCVLPFSLRYSTQEGSDCVFEEFQTESGQENRKISQMIRHPSVSSTKMVYILISAIVCIAAAGVDASETITVNNITYTKRSNVDTTVKAFRCAARRLCGLVPCVPPHTHSAANPACNISSLAEECSRTPHCAGFNSDGSVQK